VGEAVAGLRKGRGLASRAALLVVLAGALAGCGSASTGPGAAAAILADWRSFPAAANPRPLVPTGPTVLDPQNGFPDGQSKLAYVDGRFDLGVALPAGPATSNGYPLISARTAFDRLSSAADPAKTSTTYRLRVISASLGSARFDTDRGPRLLPAWRFGLAKVTGPVWVLAIDPKTLWTAKATAATDLGFRATPAADGRSLTLDFIGGPDEPTACGIAYTASAVESATAVVVVLHDEPRARADGEVVCDGAGHRRTVPLQLADALGGRVLLTPYGVPMPVPGP